MRRGATLLDAAHPIVLEYVKPFWHVREWLEFTIRLAVLIEIAGERSCDP
jgi:hypothetical protein